MGNRMLKKDSDLLARMYNRIPFIILILMVILFSILSPYFYRLNNIRNILLGITVNGTIAIGATFVMIGGGLDLSIGSIMAMSAVTSVITLNAFDSVLLAIIIALLTGMFFGFINGVLVTKGRINPFIATLGTFIALTGLVSFMTNNSTIKAEPFSYSYISQGRLLYVNFPIWILVIFFITSNLILVRTLLGRRVYSLGGNEAVCKLMGISVDNIKIFTYVFSGFCCAVAGIFISSRVHAASVGFGQFTMFQVLGAVILGGVSLQGGEGTVYKAFVGVLILAILSNAFGLMGVHIFTQRYIWGGLLILVTIMDTLKTRFSTQSI
jgi:ribose transport system permease protein